MKMGMVMNRPEKKVEFTSKAGAGKMSRVQLAYHLFKVFGWRYGGNVSWRAVVDVALWFGMARRAGQSATTPRIG